MADFTTQRELVQVMGAYAKTLNDVMTGIGNALSRGLLSSERDSEKFKVQSEAPRIDGPS